jgi:GT2 family glycosyltransferase
MIDKTIKTVKEFSDKELEVIILSYNRQDYLKLCLKSLLNQSVTNFTIIVLDNCSDFDLNDLSKEFDSNRIKYLRNITNIGSPANFDKAVSIASKQLLMIFHDDDCLPPDFISKQIDVFNEYPTVGFIVTSVNLCTEMSKMHDFKKKIDLKPELFTKKGAMIECFFTRPIFGFSSIMYKTELLKIAGTEYETYNKVSDRALMINLSRITSFVYLRELVYNALYHPNQDSAKRDWDFRYDLNLSKLFLETCYENKLFTVERDIIKSLAIFYIYSDNPFSLKKIFTEFDFKNTINKVYFLLQVPIIFIKKRIANFIKKKNLKFYFKLHDYRKRMSIFFQKK